MKKYLAASLLLAAPCAVWAASDVDAYYIPVSSFELESDGESIEFEEPSGFGIKGRFGVADKVFLTGTYESVSYDEADVEGIGSGELETDLTNFRAGVGFRFSQASPFYVQGEFVQYEIEVDEADLSDDDSGFGLHVGASSAPATGFGYYAQAGYLDVGDFGDGFEFEIGGAYKFSEVFGLFGDYHYLDVSADGVDTTVGDLRVGLRLSF